MKFLSSACLMLKIILWEDFLRTRSFNWIIISDSEKTKFNCLSKSDFFTFSHSKNLVYEFISHLLFFKNLSIIFCNNYSGIWIEDELKVRTTGSEDEIDIFF